MLSNETATFPVALQDIKTQDVHLFYVLNDEFLMYKKIDSKLFVSQDVWVDYVAPDYYDERSLDDDTEDPESSLFNFTSSGKILRQGVSYFVIGNASSTYFIEQIETTDAIKEKNKVTGSTQNIRFDFEGDEEDMDASFNGKSFAVNIDNRGLFRLFFTEEKGFSVKISSNSSEWEYLGRNLPLHKTYFSDTIKEEEVPVITNIQIARNYYEEENIHIFYFYRNMLLKRTVPLHIFKIRTDEDGNKDDTILREALTVNEDISSSRPLFIVGDIPDDILSIRVSELTSSSATDSELAILFPYTLNTLLKFDDSMAVDVTTQVCGYVLREGDIKVIYKDTLGNLNGAIIRGDSVIPEIFYKVNEETIN